MTAETPMAPHRETELALLTILGADGVLTEPHDLAPFESGWRYGHGKALLVVRPSTVEDVARVVRYAHQRHLRLLPAGANTGLVGASNPDAEGDTLVLSLARLHRTIDLDVRDATVCVDAGVTLSQLNEALAPHGLWFPIDLGADPQIGGMVATNTGGTRLLKYGDVRARTLGLEVVLPDGSRLDRLRRLRKDNTGLDSRQLFIGTSGSYGVVTRAVLSLAPLPRQRACALVGFESGDDVLAFLQHLQGTCGETLAAFEVMSRDAVDVTLEHGSGLRAPFDDGTPTWTALVELDSTLDPTLLSLDTVLEAALESFAERESSLVDAALTPPHDAWAIRHQISESLRHEGTVLALDVSVPRSQMAQFSDVVRSRLAEAHPEVRVCDFGHWGDGGTHLNLVWAPRNDDATFRPSLQAQVYDWCVHEFRGSFSAEHGVGPHNQAHYDLYTPDAVLGFGRALKQHADPERRMGTVRFEPPAD